MARYTSINIPVFLSYKLKPFRCNNSQYALFISYRIIDLFLCYLVPEHFGEKGILGIAIILKVKSLYFILLYHY